LVYLESPVFQICPVPPGAFAVDAMSSKVPMFVNFAGHASYHCRNVEYLGPRFARVRVPI
jgi:hypothetical protein